MDFFIQAWTTSQKDMTAIQGVVVSITILIPVLIGYYLFYKWLTK